MADCRGLPIGAAMLCLSVVLLSAVAFQLGPARLEATDPSVKAAALGERIAELMNVSFWGVPAGFLLGTWLTFKDRRSARTRVSPDR
jgi:hypothetical protein